MRHGNACVNAKGELVLRGALWITRNKMHLSIYCYVGEKSKRQVLLTRQTVDKDMHTKATLEVMLSNMALLWAMENGVSEFEFDRRNADHRHLYHPRVFAVMQLNKEKQS